MRLLWRRGAVPYRPLVSTDIDLDELEDERDWDDAELPETHFDWESKAGESPSERRQRIETIVEQLWEFARQWGRDRCSDWVWCDFQIVGYDEADDVLFEDGRRARLVEESSKSPRPSQATAGAPPDWGDVHRERVRGLESVITYIQGDRDDAVTRTRQTLDEIGGMWSQVGGMWSQANHAVQASLEFQREQLERWKDQASGATQLKAAAFAEMEQTRRVARLVEFLERGLDAAVAHGVPLANRFFDFAESPTYRAFPEFRCAQQAMVYLFNTLTQTQLDILFSKRKAAGAFLAVLRQGSQISNEREALEHISPLIRVLRSQRFNDVATGEQRMCAAFIMGQLAIYKMCEVNFDDEEPAMA